MSYGPAQGDVFRLAAMPRHINLKTAKALGLTVPQ
jgi:hypothetical protein